MTRVLFVTAPEKGHYHVLVGPAQILAERGHEIAFWSARELPLPAFRRFSSGMPPSADNRGERLAALLADRDRLRAWIRAMLLDGVDADVARLDRVVEELRPDVIACDPMVYAAPIAAHRARLPWAALSASLNPVLPVGFESELLLTVDALSRDRERLFARHGLEARFSGCDILSPHATIAFVTDAFVDPIRGVELVGPSRPRGPRGDEPKAIAPASIYASLGSQNWYQPELVRRLCEAVEGRDVDVVIAAGELAIRTPSNVRLVPYADQRAMLEHARLFITHGGANSVIEGLDAGVPLLVCPLVNDQPHNAWFVERSGAGRSHRIDEADPRDTWSVIESLLDGAERGQARRIQRSFRATDGAATTASRLLQLA